MTVLTSKRARRRANFPPARVPSTLKRRIGQDAGHLPPANLRTREGRFWKGAATVPRRKRGSRTGETWRAWLRRHGLQEHKAATLRREVDDLQARVLRSGRGRP